MTNPTFWILARATGLTAYLLLTGSVLAGLTVKSKPLGPRVRAADATDLHRFMSLLSLGAVAFHGLTLALDTSVPMPVAALFVPGLSTYRPLATGIGVVAAELMVLIYVSFSPAGASASGTGGGSTTSRSRCSVPPPFTGSPTAPTAGRSASTRARSQLSS